MTPDRFALTLQSATRGDRAARRLLHKMGRDRSLISHMHALRRARRGTTNLAATQARVIDMPADTSPWLNTALANGDYLDPADDDLTDAEWAALVDEAGALAEGRLSAAELVNEMVQMSASASRSVDLVNATPATSTTLTATPTSPRGPAFGLSPDELARYRVRLEDEQRINDAGWADRSAAEIRAVQEAGQLIWQASQPDYTGRPTDDPDALLSADEFTKRYMGGGG